MEVEVGDRRQQSNLKRRQKRVVEYLKGFT